MSTTTLYADNDFGGKILLEEIDPTTALPTPLLAGTVRAFIALAETDEDPALPALDVTCDYVGDEDGNEAGEFGYFFDGGNLAGDDLDALDTSELWLIIEKDADIRVALKLKYVRVRKATLA